MIIIYAFCIFWFCVLLFACDRIWQIGKPYREENRRKRHLRNYKG